MDTSKLLPNQQFGYQAISNPSDHQKALTGRPKSKSAPNSRNSIGFPSVHISVPSSPASSPSSLASDPYIRMVLETFKITSVPTSPRGLSPEDRTAAKAVKTAMNSFCRCRERASLERLNDGQTWLLLDEIAKEHETNLSNYLGRLPWEIINKAHNFEYTGRLTVETIQKFIRYFASLPALDGDNQSTTYNYLPSSSLIDNIGLAFSQISLATEPQNAWEAVQKMQIWGILLAGPVLLAGILQGVLSSTGDDNLFHANDKLILAAAGYSLYLALWGAYKIYRKCRPIPKEIGPLRNYTTAALQSRIEPLEGRDEIIRRIFLSWADAGSTVRKHPILVGPAGTGKTSIMMEVARRIAAREGVPEVVANQMQNMKVFGGVAADLLPSNPMFETEEKMDKFLRRIYGIRNRVILMIDEVHTFFSPQYRDKYADKIKSILGIGYEGIPYTLSATTTEEYQQYISQNSALSRRLMPIFVGSLGKENVHLVLRRLLLNVYPHLNVPDIILEHIFQATQESLAQMFPHLQQPEISKIVLTRSIAELEDMLDHPPERKAFQQLDTDKTHSISIQMDGINTDVRSISTYLEKLHDYNSQMTQKESNLEQYRADLGELRSLQKNYTKERNALIRLAKSLNSRNFRDEEYFSSEKVKQFVFRYFFRLPSIQKRIFNLHHKHKFPVITKEMIDKVIREYRESLISLKKEPGQPAGQAALGIISNGPVGLHNLGNSCYINAVLQALFNIPDIRDQINGLDDRATPCMQTLKQLLQTASPPTKESLKTFRQLIFKDSKNPLRGETEQQDAHELLTFFLDQLNWMPVRLSNRYTISKNTVNSPTENQTHHLSVEMDGKNSFQEALDSFFAPESMKSDNRKIEPLRLKGLAPATEWLQTLYIKAPLPKYLMVHLKRFRSDTSKITTPLSFPQDKRVQIKDENGDRMIYEIVTFINHHGLTATSGHYTADVRNFRDKQGPQRWIHCDDGQLTEMEPSNPEQGAYIVVLKRSDVKKEDQQKEGNLKEAAQPMASVQPTEAQEESTKLKVQPTEAQEESTDLEAQEEPKESGRFYNRLFRRWWR